MEALQYIKNIVYAISSKFDTTAQKIDGIPILGKYLAIPFYFFGDSLEVVSGYIDLVNDAWEWLKAEFLALPSFEELLKALEERYSILIKSPFDIYGMIKDYIPPLPEWIPESFASLIEDIIDNIPDIPTKEELLEWIGLQFEKVLDIAFKEGK